MSFRPEDTDSYIEDGRELMILDDAVPTLLIAKLSYGKADVITVLSAHLFQLANSFGVETTAQDVQDIARDILSGFGWLKITEVILAFKMMREGKFKTNDNNNRAKMYGRLSSAVVCDCLNQFCTGYRNDVIEHAKSDEIRRKRAEMERHKATHSDIRSAIYAACLLDPSQIRFYSSITKEEAMTLEYYAAERKALLLLKQRVEEYVTNPTDENKEKMAKGIEYINTKFPFDPKSVDVFNPGK